MINVVTRARPRKAVMQAVHHCKIRLAATNTIAVAPRAGIPMSRLDIKQPLSILDNPLHSEVVVFKSVRCLVTHTGGESEAARSALTPMMRQYWQIKADPQYSGYLLLFQLGNFLEAFFQDAERLSEALGIALTTRGSHRGGPIPMAGIPIHAKDAYIARLVRVGIKVVLCEQVGQGTTMAAGKPVPGLQGDSDADGNVLVQRAVTRIVTRGTIVDDSLLAPQSHNYICCINVHSGAGGTNEEKQNLKATLCWVDVSTGDFLLTTVPLQSLSSQLSAYPPAEIVVGLRGEEPEEPEGPFGAEAVLLDNLDPHGWHDRTVNSLITLAKRAQAGRLGGSKKGTAHLVEAAASQVTFPTELTAAFIDIPGQDGDAAAVSFVMAQHFEKTAGTAALAEANDHIELAKFDWSEHELGAVGALLTYVRWTQGGKLPALRFPARIASDSQITERGTFSIPTLQIDATTQRALEIVRPTHGRRRAKGSLLHTMDECTTALGSRLLDQRLCRPLASKSAISNRLDAVQFLYERPELRKSIQCCLTFIPDVERCLQRISLGRGASRELLLVREGLLAMQQLGLLVATGDFVRHHVNSKSTKNPSLNPATPAGNELVQTLRSQVAAAIIQTMPSAQCCPLSASQQDFDFADSFMSTELPPVLLVAAAACLSSLRGGVPVLPYKSTAQDGLIALSRLFPQLEAALIDSPLGVDGSETGGNDQPTAIASWIKDGFNAELDKARAFRDSTTVAIAGLQETLRKMTGIRTLKIKRTDEHGYAVEVPTQHADTLDRFAADRHGGGDWTAGSGSMPAVESLKFSRIKTLKSAVRFRCGPVTKLDTDISMATARAQSLETAIINDLCRAVMGASSVIQAMARAVAVIDVSASLAQLASKYKLTRPRIVSAMDGFKPLSIQGGRHLVVERSLLEGWGAVPSAESDGFEDAANPPQLPIKRTSPVIATTSSAAGTVARHFVPNDVWLQCPPSMAQVSATARSPEASVALICGPNMGGKSTYLRQTAHAVIMSQMGSYIAADSAVIAVVDRVFSRIGAADDVTRDKSTFLMEMEETALITAHATSNSLVVVDEIGRGTSIMDGIAIAAAVLEYLALDVRCRTLFATHMHELTGVVLSNKYMHNSSCGNRVDAVDRVQCLTMAVDLTDRGVPLLTHKVVPHPIYDAIHASGASPEDMRAVWRRILSMSYGVHVARVAGLPNAVVSRASEILDHLDASQAAVAWAQAVTSMPHKGHKPS